jgi:hypothetical protein
MKYEVLGKEWTISLETEMQADMKDHKFKASLCYSKTKKEVELQKPGKVV